MDKLLALFRLLFVEPVVRAEHSTPALSCTSLRNGSGSGNWREGGWRDANLQPSHTQALHWLSVSLEPQNWPAWWRAEYKYGLAHITWADFQWHHVAGWSREHWESPQMQTGLQNLEWDDLNTNLGEPKQEDDYESENWEKLGSWDVTIWRGDFSCQMVR